MTDSPTQVQLGEGVEEADPAALAAYQQEQALFQNTQMEYLLGRSAYLRKEAERLASENEALKARVAELESQQTN